MYKKILDEAIEELKTEIERERNGKEEDVEQKQQQVHMHPFTKDCTIDTDLEILIPDDYVHNIAERLNLYRELDDCNTEAELSLFESNLVDRFGKIPQPCMELIHTVRLRQQAIQAGIEKLVLRRGKMLCHFVSEKNSPLFRSDTFSRVLDFVQSNPSRCRLSEKHRLVLSVEEVQNVSDAGRILACFTAASS
jgi:transcription-repair coupling factor (superfamily II helicase)